jgi:hypothetical protein
MTCPQPFRNLSSRGVAEDQGSKDRYGWRIFVTEKAQSFPQPHTVQALAHRLCSKPLRPCWPWPLRECRICGHGISILWRSVNRTRPASSTELKPCGRLSIKLHESDSFSLRAVLNSLAAFSILFRSSPSFFCELGDGVRPLRLLFGGTIGPTGSEPIHNRLVCYTECPLILISPSLWAIISNVANRCLFPFVIETFAVSRQRCHSYGPK